MCFIIFNIFTWFKTWYVSFFFNILLIISTDPAKITGLRVNGHETNGTYLTNENQEVKISCSFTNGNPPVGVRIVDGSSNILSSTKHEEDLLVLSLGAYRCHEVWPTIRCEAPGSELNRSVSIFVKCKFEFLLTKLYVLNKINTSSIRWQFKAKSLSSEIVFVFFSVRCLILLFQVDLSFPTWPLRSWTWKQF